MRALLLLLLLTALVMGAVDAAASPWSAELRGGLALPSDDLGGTSLSAVGFGLEGTAAYRFLPHLEVYGGGGGWSFSTETLAFLGLDYDVKQTGWVTGLRFVHPLGGPLFTGILRAGLTWEHLEVERDGTTLAESDHDLGWEIGAAVGMKLSERLMLTPGVRYRVLSTTLESAEAEQAGDVEMENVAFELGLRFSF